MAKKTTNFILGLFVILGFVLAVGAIIFIGATSLFQPGRTYITYFNESVEGLQKDSSVKFRGVEVGRVQDIRVAPDNKLIGVVMKINMRGDLTKELVAQLQMTGITGVKYVGLDRQTPEAMAQAPKITFPSEYPVIPSEPSQIHLILTGISELVDKLQKIDTEAISSELLATIKSIHEFFQGKPMTTTMARLQGTAGNLEKFTAGLNQAAGPKNLSKIVGGAQNVLGGAHGSIKELNVLLANLQKDLKGMRLPETAARYRAVAQDVEGLSQSLKEASAALEKFLNRINDRPPDLLFGKPPPKRFNE